MSLHPKVGLFANCSSSNACIMVLPKLTFVSFVLNFFWHYCVGDNFWYVLYGFKVSAVLTGVLLM